MEVNPIIAEAVRPLRQMAIDATRESVQKWHLKIKARIVEFAGKLEEIAPIDYNARDVKVKRAYNSLIRTLTTAEYYHVPMWGQKAIVTWSDEKAEAHILRMIDQAVASYDAYVAKLSGKVEGEIKSAALSSGALWDHSILIVTMADGSAQKWKTQMILNCSGLGTLFNQWPTRLLKG